MRSIGLSATVAEPESLARFLVPQRGGASEAADIVVAGGAAARSSRCSIRAKDCRGPDIPRATHSLKSMT